MTGRTQGGEMSGLPGRRLTRMFAVVTVGLMLAACGMWPFGNGVPQPLPTRAGYSASDSALLRVRAVDIGCCYIEGSLHFAQLSGPTSMTWQVNPRSWRRESTDSFVFEDGPIGVLSGSYT